MDDAVIQLARQLLDGGFTRLWDREQRVITHIAKRQHISRDINAVQEENQTFGDRLADKVARFGGSWTFIVIFTSMLLAWVILNTVVLYPIYFEKRSFSSSGSRWSLTQRRSAMTKGSRFRRTSKSPTRRVRSSALGWQ